jgi:uncharacterized membrane protein
MADTEGRKRALDRLVSFSDAVVSIAATLLILPLVSNAGDIGHRSVGQLLADNRQPLIVFFLSFAVILRFWYGHHKMYQHVADFTPALIGVNALWLLAIVFLPFPTVVIGTVSAHDVASNALYIGTMLVASAASFAGEWIIVAHPDLQTADSRGTVSLRPVAALVISMTAAFVIAVTVPAIGLWALLLLVVSGPIERWIAHRPIRR